MGATQHDLDHVRRFRVAVELYRQASAVGGLAALRAAKARLTAYRAALRAGVPESVLRRIDEVSRASMGEVVAA